MHIQLWQWSAAVQVSSLAMIALFFAVLSRSMRGPGLRWWVLAWVSNLGALGVTLFFWSAQPTGEIFVPALRGAYMGSKTAFVLLFLEGAWAIKHPGATLIRPLHLTWGLALFALACGLFVGSIEAIGVVQHALLAGLFVLGASLLLRGPAENRLGWLAAGCAARALLGAVEAFAYATQLLPATAVSAAIRDTTALFLSVHSSFDSGAEWFLALGCVLALSERAARELTRYNRELLTAQHKLRKLVDRDPLTALTNRRSLPQAFDAVRSEGATLLFFDLDDFKMINDLHGHQTGDLCLKRFATALAECFRPGDALLRYAGDEFLVVASGLDVASATERVDHLRRRLRAGEGTLPPLSFSVGIAELEPGEDPEAALRTADQSMYRSKGRPPHAEGRPATA